MTKKDFQTFARMIRSQRHAIQNNITDPANFGGTIGEEEAFTDGAEKMLSIIIDELVTIFQNDNPKFDAEKFIKACEIDTESKNEN